MNLRVLEPALVLLSLLVFFSSYAYGELMFDGTYTWETVVEALNFSVQTVTTVGYGNWMPAGVSLGDPRVFWVKVISLPTMLAGAALFTITIAILVEMCKE